MKRSFISLGLIVAATFALTNCTKDIENPSDKPETAGIPFEIIASTADTKTTNDGVNTNWAAEDAINLFHAEAATTDYTNDGKFSLADTETGRFTGTLASDLTASAYDWYAFYPYNSYTTTPANNSAGRTYIGCRSDEVQTQDGLNNMNHIDGDNYPLYGYAKNVSKDAKPELSMKHVSSLLKIVVTNTLSEPLEVEDVSFTAPESIVGYYYVNFSTDPCTFTEYNTYQSNTAVLEVSNAVIPAGETGEFYLAIKPFTAAKDSKLYLSVNGYQKDITLPKDVTFESGKIKTLNFSYDKPVVEGSTVIEIVSSELGIDNAVDVTSLNDGLVVFAKGTNTSNAPKYYTSGSAVRMYTGNTLTVTAPSGNILTEIAFTFVSGYAVSLTCTNSIGYSNGTWTGELEKVIFNVSGSTQARITKMVITYKAGEVDAPEITEIEVVDPKTEYYVNTEFVEPTVNAVYSNGTVEPVEGAQFTGYDSTKLGKQTITVTYEGFTTSYDIEVVKAEGEKYSLFTGPLEEGDYIIVYDGGAMKAAISSDRLAYQNVEVVDESIFDPDASIVWHIAKSGTYWTIYNASVNKYAAGTGAKNKAQLLVSGTDDKSLWTASDSYEFVNKANEKAGVNKNLRRNGTYGFACYSTSTGGALSLYKKN